MPLPVEPPVAPMLALLSREIPREPGWVFEPKWDGFRAVVFRDGEQVRIQSRESKDLVRYFPELPPVFRAALPRRCVVDGEIVIPGESGTDFDALLLRIHPAASRIEKLARETPASFVAFDLLALGDEDLRRLPFDRRRAKLAAIFRRRAAHPRVTLTPETADREAATRWLAPDSTVEGVIARRVDLPYVAGERVMVKVKRARTADCVVGGYRRAKNGKGIGSLLLGLYRGNSLCYVGHTSGFSDEERVAIHARLVPLETTPDRSFAPEHAPGGPSRWRRGREPAWTPVRPELVVEVEYDKMQGDRFRHATRFVRWREDRSARSCTWAQLRQRAPRPASARPRADH